VAEINPILMFIILVALLGFSAFFSGTETALTAISKLRVRHLAEKKPIRAKLLERMLKNPERIIGTILLGNNLVNVAMSALATAMAISIWGEAGIVYVTAVITLAILIFAEITPKVYAKYFNERVSLITAPVLNVMMLVLHPFVWAVTFVSKKMLYLIGVDISKVKRPLMTEEEIITCIKMGWDEGAITAEEKNILSRAFTLNDKTVKGVMVPKEKMITLNADTSIKEAFKVILKTGHSRFPILERNASDIVGFIHVKDLFQLMDKKRRARSLKKITRPPFLVSEDTKIDSLLRSFKARKLHQAVVLDQEGNVSGLITLEDILEELVGSIQDEHDRD
jgi:Mg2+/Co2+ transporter CorB